MQTLDFTRALTEIIAELKIRELYGLLSELLIAPLSPINPPQPQHQHPVPQDRKKVFASLLFESHAGYDRLSRIGSPGKILAGMDVKELYEPSRLALIMNLVSNIASIEQLRGSNNLEILDFFETLKAFIRLQKTCKTLLEEEKIGEIEPTDSILEVQVTDYECRGIEPERLSAVFSTLAELQMNVTRLLRIEDHRLIVKYLDSGTDVKIGLEGVKDAIDAARDLLLQFWDKIRFRDQDTFEKDIEALSKGLEFLAKTKEAVATGAITAEEAGNLKARVFRGVDDLVGLGVTMPLKGETAEEQRRQLIDRRNTKLLVAGDDKAPPVEPAPPGQNAPEEVD